MTHETAIDILIGMIFVIIATIAAYGTAVLMLSL